MGDIIILKENGKWCIFTTISDERLIDDATKQEVIEYFMKLEKERLEQRLLLIQEGKTPVRYTYQQAIEREIEVHGKEYLEQGWDSKESESVE